MPKKGRPVTQCQHCRAERKKRSAHVKCECGEKPHTKEKCIHLREAEAKAAVTAATAIATSGTTTPINATAITPPQGHAPTSDIYPLSEESSADEHHCCCPHGGQCICSTMKTKESSEDLADSYKATHCRPKPRLASHQSEGHLTVFANGHHKPVHRNNNAAHESGAPYKLPRVHTTHAVARSSVDSLASMQSTPPVQWQQHATNSLLGQLEQRKPQSELGSPATELSAGLHMPRDIRAPAETACYAPTEPAASVPTPISTFQDFGFPSAQSDLSIATSCTEPSYSMPGSALDLQNNMSDFWGNVDWNKLEPAKSSEAEVQPALTNASSGTMSEIDDLPAMDELNAFDASYRADGQNAMTQLEMGNNVSDHGNYGDNFNMAPDQVARWSMPIFPSQNNASFTCLSTGQLSKQSSSRDLSSQAMNAVSLTSNPYQQGVMQGSGPSTQPQSPSTTMPDALYQGKEASMPGFDWQQLLPTYGTNVTSGNEGAGEMIGFATSSSGQASVTGASNFQETSGYSDFNNFDNSFRTMQWNDGVVMPVDQNLVDTYDYESGWPMNNFPNQWN